MNYLLTLIFLLISYQTIPAQEWSSWKSYDGNPCLSKGFKYRVKIREQEEPWKNSRGILINYHINYQFNNEFDEKIYFTYEVWHNNQKTGIWGRGSLKPGEISNEGAWGPEHLKNKELNLIIYDVAFREDSRRWECDTKTFKYYLPSEKVNSIAEQQSNNSPYQPSYTPNNNNQGIPNTTNSSPSSSDSGALLKSNEGNIKSKTMANNSSIGNSNLNLSASSGFNLQERVAELKSLAAKAMVSKEYDKALVFYYEIKRLDPKNKTIDTEIEAAEFLKRTNQTSAKSVQSSKATSISNSTLSDEAASNAVAVIGSMSSGIANLFSSMSDKRHERIKWMNNLNNKTSELSNLDLIYNYRQVKSKMSSNSIWQISKGIIGGALISIPISFYIEDHNEIKYPSNYVPLGVGTWLVASIPLSGKRRSYRMVKRKLENEMITRDLDPKTVSMVKNK